VGKNYAATNYCNLLQRQLTEFYITQQQHIGRQVTDRMESNNFTRWLLQHFCEISLNDSNASLFQDDIRVTWGRHYPRGFVF